MVIKMFKLLVLGILYSFSANAEYTEKLVIKQILRGYSKDARPVDHPSDTLPVSIGINLKRIFNLDAKHQVLTAYIWLKMDWYDRKLLWRPAEYDNITDIRMPLYNIWVPDIELLNSADDLVQLSDGKYPAIVRYNGSVSIVEPKKIRSMCDIDVFYFAFDTQVCQLNIGSWTHHGFDIDLWMMSDNIEVDKFANNGEWEVLETSISRKTSVQGCCGEPTVEIIATIVIRRMTLYYVLDTIIPFILLSFLTVMMFQLRVDQNLGLRIFVGLTAFVVFCVYFWQETGDVARKPNGVPLIVIYMTSMLLLTMSTVFGTIFVWKLHTEGVEACKFSNSCINCLSSKSYKVKHDDKNNIPLTDCVQADSANVQETSSVSSLVVGDKIPGPNRNHTTERSEGKLEHISAAQKLDRLLFRVIGSIVLVLNLCIFVVALVK